MGFFRPVLTCVGCGAVFFALLDCSSFGTSAGPDGLSDAANDSLDRPSDVVATDAGADLDGGCPEGAFCDDFDEGELGDRWDDIVHDNVERLELEPTAPLSPPFALRVAIPGNMKAGPVAAMLERRLRAPKSLRCSFSVRNERALGTLGRNLDLFQVKVETAELDAYWLRFGGRSDFGVREDVYLPDDGGCRCPGYESKERVQLEPGVWRRIELSTDFRTVSLRVDGAPLVSAAITNVQPTGITVRLGLASQSLAQAEMSFDDFVCELLE